MGKSMTLAKSQKLVDEYNKYSFMYNRAINLKRGKHYCKMLGDKAKRAFRLLIDNYQKTRNK
jgi:hypothetical protein